MSDGAAELLLRVGVGARCGPWGAGGTLIVERGAVRFEFGRTCGLLSVPPVIHAVAPLTLVRALLLPPGFRTGVILRGREGVVSLLTWWGTDRRVRRALRASGVRLEERTTWASVGWGEGAVGRIG